MTPSPLCDLCGGKQADPVVHKNDLSYVRCRNCGFVFTFPPPPDLDEINDDYFQEKLDAYIASNYSEKRQQRYRKTLRSLAPYRGQGRLLEIGCNVGGFLFAAKELGWDPVGVDPVAPCIRYAQEEKGLNAIAAYLGEAKLEENSFDVVYSNAVFEHLSSPSLVMTQIARLLRPGGIVYTKTVNFDSYTREKMGDKWNLLAPAGHLSLFNAETLAGFGKKAGLKTLRIQSNGVRLPPQPFRELRKGWYSLCSRFTYKGDRIIVWSQKQG